MTRTSLPDEGTGRRWAAFRGFSRPAVNVVLSGLVLVVALLAGAAWVIVERRDEAIAGAQRETASLSLALAEHTSRTFQAVDVSLMNIAEKSRLAAIGSPRSAGEAFGTRAGQDMLNDQMAGLKQIKALGVFGADGSELNRSGIWPIPTINISDRDYFRALRDSPDLNSFISEPIINRVDGAWTVVMARRITAPGAGFIGLVTAVIDLKYFEDLYRALSAGDGDSVGLSRQDGTLLARYPPADYKIGEPMIAADGAFRGSVIAETVGNGLEMAQRFATNHVDGVNRLLTMRVLRDFPLVLTVARTEASITAEWRRQAIAIGGGAFLAAAALALATILLARQLTRREASEAALAAALEYMSDGIMMVSRDRRIQVCNRHAIEMFNLPPDLMAKHPLFDDVLGHAWKADGLVKGGKSSDEIRDSFGMSTTLSHEPQIYEAPLPTGEVIEIRSNPLPDGGVVRTYTDVSSHPYARDGAECRSRPARRRRGGVAAPPR